MEGVLSKPISIVIPTKFKIQEYPHALLKIIPFKESYTAKEYEKIANIISKYNQAFFERFKVDKETKTLLYQPVQPISFEILITKNKISYYYAVPEIYKQNFKNKIKFILPYSEIIESENDFLDDFKDYPAFRIGETYHWFLTLNTQDINITDYLTIIHKNLNNDNDKILIQYLFKPIFDNDWKHISEGQYNKHLYSNNNTIASSTISNKILNFLEYITAIIDEILEMLISAIFNEKTQKTAITTTKRDFSEATKKKTLYDGFQTNINIYVKSNNHIVIQNIKRDIEVIIQDMTSDNKLQIIKTQKNSLPSRKLQKPFVLNTQEVIQFLKFPSKKVMEEFDDLIDKVNIESLEVPSELFNSDGIPLGEIVRGNIFKPITFGTDANSLSKPLVYLSYTEGGKSTFLRNYSIEALKRGHSVFTFDTIDGLTAKIIRDHLPKSFPEDKIIVLDFRDTDYVFPLAWNEISEHYIQQLRTTNDPIKKYIIMNEYSSKISNELKRFINTIQLDNERLTSKMEDVFNVLAKLVFMNNGNFETIKECLYNRELRHKLLDNLKLPSNIPFKKEVLRIDDEPENSQTLRGIETRLNKLIENNKNFSLNTDKKLDFAKWANEGYCVIMIIPKENANSLITFIVQKLWLAITTSRYNIPEEQRRITNLLIDEPNEFQGVFDIIKEQLIASRKWHLRFVFCIHNINIFRDTLANLTSAGASFIMLPTSYMNFNAINEFFRPYTYDTLKEVEKLTSKHEGKYKFALCSIHYKNVNYPMVVKLPLPPEQRYDRINRSHLNKICAQKYGINIYDYYKKENMEFNNINNAKINI